MKFNKISPILPFAFALTILSGPFTYAQMDRSASNNQNNINNDQSRRANATGGVLNDSNGAAGSDSAAARNSRADANNTMDSARPGSADVHRNANINRNTDTTGSMDNNAMSGTTADVNGVNGTNGVNTNTVPTDQYAQQQQMAPESRSGPSAGVFVLVALLAIGLIAFVMNYSKRQKIA
jgi:hypothetical protein